MITHGKISGRSSGFVAMTLATIPARQAHGQVGDVSGSFTRAGFRPTESLPLSVSRQRMTRKRSSGRTRIDYSTAHMASNLSSPTT